MWIKKLDWKGIEMKRRMFFFSLDFADIIRKFEKIIKGSKLRLFFCLLE